MTDELLQQFTTDSVPGHPNLQPRDAATLILLEKVVLSRLADLNTSVSSIRISQDLTSRVKVAGNDELTSLGTSINGMLEALSQTQIKLEQTRDEALEALKLKAQIVGP